MAKRTAIFGGSFDPIHIGHAMIANFVSQSGLVDELWIVPGKVNPLKTDTPPAPAEDRLILCGMVADKCDNTEVCDIELRLPGPSFTYRTLSLLRERFPEREFALLIGSDNWLSFDRWKNYRDIINEFDILIYLRPGYDINSDSLPPRVKIIKNSPQMLISSSYIRENLCRSMNLNFFLPQDVLNYIEEHDLY